MGPSATAPCPGRSVNGGQRVVQQSPGKGQGVEGATLGRDTRCYCRGTIPRDPASDSRADVADSFAIDEPSRQSAMSP